MRYSLVTIIVNRGKGSKVLKFAQEQGAKEASCLLGTGTINNKMLKIIEMSDVEKEIILIVIPTERESVVLHNLNEKFNFERKNTGIAFTTPLASVMKIKRDTNINWNDDIMLQNLELENTVLLVIVDKGKAEDVVRLSQNAGYYGGTIIKAHGSAGKLNVVLDMLVEPEKEAVLMLIKSESADHLANILNDELHLTEPNMGILLQYGVSKTIGLFKDENHKEEQK